MSFSLCASKRKQSGLAAVEMTIILPLLLTLSLGIVDLLQALQAHNIVVNIGREGANLVSRTKTQSPQQIMDALAQTASSLDFPQNGYIYINLVVGDNQPNPYVEEQLRWSNAGNVQTSKVWADCPSWRNDDSCRIPATRPRLAQFPMALNAGESVYVVEVLYDYQLLTTYVFDNDLQIYSQALM